MFYKYGNGSPEKSSVLWEAKWQDEVWPHLQRGVSACGPAGAPPGIALPLDLELVTISPQQNYPSEVQALGPWPGGPESWLVRVTWAPLGNTPTLQLILSAQNLSTQWQQRLPAGFRSLELKPPAVFSKPFKILN